MTLLVIILILICYFLLGGMYWFALEADEKDQSIEALKDLRRAVVDKIDRRSNLFYEHKKEIKELKDIIKEHAPWELQKRDDKGRVI